MAGPRAWIAALLVATAFEASAQAPVPVSDPETPLQFKGFRIKPPPGKDWYIAKKDDRGVMFLKKTGDRFHTFYARASAEPMHPDLGGPEEMLKTMKEQSDSRSSAGSRHEQVKFDYAADDTLAPGCFRYSMSAMDTKVPGAGGKALQMTILGYACVHPESPRTVVDIMYSERGSARSGAGTYGKEGDDFIRGLVFTPVE